jgi:hypothetical protein
LKLIPTGFADADNVVLAARGSFKRGLIRTSETDLES